MLGYALQIAEKIKGRETPSKVPGSLFWREDNFGISGVLFDLLINETHGMEFDVSEHTIENGETVSDNVRRRLRKVTIVGLFTNHGISRMADEWFDPETGEVKDGKDEIKLNGEPMTENYALEMWEGLKAVASERKPVKLVAALEVYDNMVISSLRAARGPEDGEAIKFEMELVEVKSIDLVQATYDSGNYSPKKQDSAENRAAANNKNSGKVSGQDVKAEEMGQDLAGANQGEIGGV